MTVIVKGKTKTITTIPGIQGIGLVTTKDDITSEDGVKRDVIPGKAELSTRTTCNVFDMLSIHGVPLAYEGRNGPISFLTRICKMIPAEVVVRGIATGSYTKRNPNIKDGTKLDPPVTEFFYKTTGRQIGDQKLPCDDPLMLPGELKGSLYLFHPRKIQEDAYIGRLENISDEEGKVLIAQLQTCKKLALEVFKILDIEWRDLGGVLYDFKLEFGILPDGEIVVADVIDCDSWRVKRHGIQLSKQGYRDGDDLDKVRDVYFLAAKLTDQMV